VKFRGSLILAFALAVLLLAPLAAEAPQAVLPPSFCGPRPS